MEKNKVRPKVLLAVSLLLCAVCAFLMPLVNVNTDMTKYLPDDSRMRKGLEILNGEFDTSAMAVEDVRVMMQGVPEDKTQAVKEKLGSMAGVDAVSVRKSGDYTLFGLVVSKSVDQKRLAKEIRKGSLYETVTQTSQDGNTPDPMALVFAVCVLVVILLIMCNSWLEPVVFLASTGMAVVVNIGTNAFFESVSITTNSITAVLQLALSMDYSIILMNRYRQEKEAGKEKYDAMASAQKNAASSIVSSALTTVVGLLMLVFMHLKIGADLGIVLAKGVICSLLYAYICLPGLILFLDSAIEASAKPVPKLSFDGVADWAGRNKVLLTVLFVIIFFGSYFLHNRTEMSFSTNTESAIDKVFPKQNSLVLIYSNEDETAVGGLVDRVSRTPEVETAISYPSLMLKEMTAPQMVEMLRGLAPEETGMLSEELMRMAYYAYHSGDDELKISFPDLVGFIDEQISSGNPLLAPYLDSGMKEKLEMLRMVTGESDFRGPAQSSGTVSPHGPCAMEEQEVMPIREYMEKLASLRPGPLTSSLLSLTDKELLHRRMGVEEMTAYMGSTPSQTRMVYSMSKSKSGMTPLEFVHFLSDDLFSRKALASMVSAEQKDGLRLRLKIMEYADRDAELTLDELDALVKSYGVEPLPRGVVNAGADSAAASVQGVSDNAAAGATDVKGAPAVTSEAPASAGISAADTSTVAADTTASPGSAQIAAAEEPRQIAAPEEDPRLALLMRMMQPGRRYSASAMSRNFSALGEKVDPGMMSLLYMFYGASRNYDPGWTMCLKSFVDYLTGDVLNDSRFEPFIDDAARSGLSEMKSRMDEGVGKMRGPEHSIAAVISSFKDESPQTEEFIRSFDADCQASLSCDYYLVGESVMFCEMKDGFRSEMLLVTILTILAILLIVTVTFRSLPVALVLVMTVMSAVFINVTISGVGGRTLLYLAYLIVQSILMGATIDYGILFANYYRSTGDLRASYSGSVHTILTSGMIMVGVPGMLAVALDDAMIRPIGGNLSIGALSAVLLILFVTPGVLSLIYRKR